MGKVTIAGIALMLLITACAPAEQGGETKHQISDTTPPEISREGPALGVLEEDWRVTLHPGRMRVPEFHLAGGSLIAATDKSVEAYNASTGEKLWHYREPRTDMWVGTSGNIVIIGTNVDFRDDGAGVENPEQLIGLNAGTGEQLWERHNDWRVGSLSGIKLTTADGILPVLEKNQHDSTELSGIDIRTGEIAWTTNYDECGIANIDPPEQTDGSLVLLAQECERSNLQAFDPANGKRLWAKNSNVRGSVSEQVSSVWQGTTMISNDSGFIRIHRDGEQRRHRFEVQLGAPIGPYVPTGENTDTTMLDIRTGLTSPHAWSETGVSEQSALDSDETLYTFNDSVSLLPYGFSVGDPKKGMPDWMPIPSSPVAHGTMFWTATAGERLLIAYANSPGQVRLFAYSATPAEGPVEFGGVPKSAWPDPCDIPGLPGATGETETETGETINIGPKEVAQPKCAIRIKDPEYLDPDQLYVQIEWVAAKPEHIQDWIVGEPGPNGVDEYTDDGVYVRARIGRVLLRFWNYSDTELTEEEVLTALGKRFAGY